MVKITDLAETYRGNAWPAMLEALGEQLGVSAESLRRLNVGFVPIVEFGKKGMNYSGWWATPERNADAEVVGLSLRSRDNGAKGRTLKPMIPGSKHGLTFPIKEGWKAGAKAYTPGAHNWKRTAEIGVNCPICGKGDGCLVSAENPTDPRAVICCRTVEGAVRPEGIGYLHHRKREAAIVAGSPLPDSPYPVFIVEGMSDTASILDLGFVAVGRPSNLAGLGMLRELVRGRDVVIIGENDRPDSRGRIAGHDGMVACAEVLQSVCPSVVRILPPEGPKDFREWRRLYSLSKADLLRYVAEHGDASATATTLDNREPLYIAEKWLKECKTVDGVPVLRSYKGIWYEYHGDHYREIDEKAAVRGRLYDWLDGRMVQKQLGEDDAKVEPYGATRSKVSDIIDALSRSCPIDAEPPCWLDGRTEPSPRDLIVFRNGVLDVDAFVATGDADLIPASPMLFTVNAVPYDYNPTAQCPQWMDFVRQVLPNDPAKVALLQEWVGYNLIPDMSLEKMMLFIGRSRSGKGTVLEVLRHVIGPEQVASTSFASLCEKYGKAPLVGKLAAILPDARIPRQADSMQALETLLQIIGQDGVDVRRMALPTIPYLKLSCRFTAAVNELPDLPDHSQALEPRLLILHFTECFIGKEDRTLKVRLPKEAPGILNWALDGLVRLRRRGQFTNPTSTDNILTDLRRTTSPTAEWMSDCCTINSNAFVTEEMAFNCWVGWCRERGLTAGVRSKFKSRLLAVCPTARTTDDLVNGQKIHKILGIALDNAARTKYLGRPV